MGSANDRFRCDPSGGWATRSDASRECWECCRIVHVACRVFVHSVASHHASDVHFRRAVVLSCDTEMCTRVTSTCCPRGCACGRLRWRIFVGTSRARHRTAAGTLVAELKFQPAKRRSRTAVGHVTISPPCWLWAGRLLPAAPDVRESGRLRDLAVRRRRRVSRMGEKWNALVAATPPSPPQSLRVGPGRSVPIAVAAASCWRLSSARR